MSLIYHYLNFCCRNFMIKKDIFYSKIQDYTFLVLFFLIFSFSIIFIIRPTLKTLFLLEKELKDLEEINRIYDQKILMISQIQYFFENNREKIPLIKDAVPHKPNLAKVIDDVNQNSSESGIVIKKMSTATTNLKEDKEKKYNNLILNIEGEADFSKIMIFYEELLKKRRLKMIEQLIITKEKESTSSSDLLKFQMEVSVIYI